VLLHEFPPESGLTRIFLWKNRAVDRRMKIGGACGALRASARRTEAVPKRNTPFQVVPISLKSNDYS
jgi:hypothetical protein